MSSAFGDNTRLIAIDSPYQGLTRTSLESNENVWNPTVQTVTKDQIVTQKLIIIVSFELTYAFIFITALIAIFLTILGIWNLPVSVLILTCIASGGLFYMVEKIRRIWLSK